MADIPKPAGISDAASLQRVIYHHPLIDNHAHNILKRSSATNYASYPFESIASEAQGESLTVHALSSLPHLRAVNQLAEFYRCAPKWDVIKAERKKAIAGDYDGLVRRCLQGSHMLLIDDGLAADNVEGYSWHDEFTQAETKRIVRIETVAVNVVQGLLNEGMADRAEALRRQSPPSREQVVSMWNAFHKRFVAEIHAALGDPEVAGFKSVICYRTGLNIENHAEDDFAASFWVYLQQILDRGDTRIEIKPLNDYLVTCTIRRIQKWSTKDLGPSKPIQFHTGLGDSDINLRLSNPAYLQPVIEKYNKVDFVLLHSAYPYTREAGYLCSTYPNAYLDIGEVFPMVSRDGQNSILRQSLELVPTSKILWSTDGHYHPETFWLANRQFRQALDSVGSSLLHTLSLNTS
jgi:predicted TIM-barrel fold metal-dependent hydrolase